MHLGFDRFVIYSFEKVFCLIELMSRSKQFRVAGIIPMQRFTVEGAADSPTGQLLAEIMNLDFEG